MAKVIKYGDTSGIESDFKQAPVGLYTLKCEEINQRTSNNKEEMVEVVFRPTHDANQKKLKEKYGRLWYYAPLDPDASWARRLKELVLAFGLKSKGGNIASIEGKSCLGRLREDTDLNGEYRPNIGKLMPMPEDTEDEEEETSEDGDLDEMERAELKAYIKENGLEVRVLKSMDDEDIVAAIREVEEEATEEEDEEDEEEPDEDEEDEAEEEPVAEEDNYDDMSVKELRQELEDRELETKGARKALVARLRTDDVQEPV